MHNCQPFKTQLTNAHFQVRFYSSCYDEMQLGSVPMWLFRHMHYLLALAIFVELSIEYVTDGIHLQYIK